MIREVIVVEGKDDIAAVKSALDCQVVATGGFAFGQDFLEELRAMEARQGVIIFTDPDYEGKRIRRRLTQALKEPKQAFLPQDRALRGEDIGVENASKEAIREAILRARPLAQEAKETFTMADLRKSGLVGGKKSRVLRERVCDLLGIGHCNGKQVLGRLNHFQISREDFQEALEKARREEE